MDSTYLCTAASQKLQDTAVLTRIHRSKAAILANYVYSITMPHCLQVFTNTYLIHLIERRKIRTYDLNKIHYYCYYKSEYGRELWNEKENISFLFS
jgi:hypothetical protein